MNTPQSPPVPPAAVADQARPFGPEDRRGRRRRATRVPGWAYHGGQAGRVSEVRMRNVSPQGAGFVSKTAFAVGQAVYLKVGLGPRRLPRRAEVAFVRPRGDGTFEVGVRFAVAAVKQLAA